VHQLIVRLSIGQCDRAGNEGGEAEPDSDRYRNGDVDITAVSGKGPDLPVDRTAEPQTRGGTDKQRYPYQELDHG
jgi:hypothetical protein